MKRLIVLFPIVLALLSGITTANAQRPNDPTDPQGDYALTWYTIDGGGATFSAGGAYSLGGMIGQPDAGVLSGGSYQLNGGFWGGASIINANLLPLVVKNFK